MITLLVLVAGLAAPAAADLAPMPGSRRYRDESTEESRRQYREQLAREAQQRKDDADAEARAREAAQAAEIDRVNDAAAAAKAERDKRLLFETGAAVAVLGVAAAWGLRRSSTA